ncbi:MAG: archease [Zetaproteobacteria bacterium]|nr:MAG: archease [Zetaproteobacteria bacterium]
MSSVGWEHFHHDADIGVRGYGKTPGEAFEQVALAMMAVVINPGDVRAYCPVDISLRASELDMLLFDWLNELVFIMAARGMVFGRFDVQVDVASIQLTAKAWGEPLQPERHAPAVEIKGVTLTELVVRRLADGRWLAQCVVDV